MKYFEASLQAEQVKIIGARLLEERQKQEIALEAIAAKTYIPLRLLREIEAGRLESLPQPIFTQGLIRRYADALGLDGTAISKEFPVNLSPIPGALGPQRLTEVTLSRPQATAAPVPVRLQPDTSTEEAAPPHRNRELKWSALPWIPISGVIGLGVLAIVDATTFKPLSESVQDVSPVSSTNPAQPVAAKVSSDLKNAVKVKMNVTEDSWVGVIVDGRSVYSGNLTQGTTRSWTGKKQVAVTAGNASGVSLSYNDGAMKAVGAPGEVKTMTFPPNLN